jgi:hypothetical protein
MRRQHAAPTPYGRASPHGDPAGSGTSEASTVGVSCGDVMAQHLHTLPEPLLLQVLLQLAQSGAASSIGAVSCVCRALAQLGAEDELWSALWQHRWPVEAGVSAPSTTPTNVRGSGLLRRLQPVQLPEEVGGGRPDPIALAHAMAASAPPGQRRQQQLKAALVLHGALQAAAATAAPKAPHTLTPPAHAAAPPPRGSLRALFRCRSIAIRRQQQQPRRRQQASNAAGAPAAVALPVDVASRLGRALAVVTGGDFWLEGAVTDASDGNVSPAQVVLALRDGCLPCADGSSSSSSESDIGSRVDHAAGSGAAGSTADRALMTQQGGVEDPASERTQSAAAGVATGPSTLSGPSSAYARAGSLRARVRYGRGSLHNSPSDAVWSGGWCAAAMASWLARQQLLACQAAAAAAAAAAVACVGDAAVSGRA